MNIGSGGARSAKRTLNDISDDPWRRVAYELEDAMRDVAHDAFDRTVALLNAHRGRWFVEGLGRSGLVARMFAMRLVHLGRTVHVVGDATTPAISSGDGYCAFSGSGRTPALLLHATKARDRGATILAVTTDSASPLADLADVVLTVPKPPTIQIPGSPVELATLALTDALILRLTGADPAAYADMAAIHANLE